MIVFTCIGIIVAAIWAALLSWLLAIWTAGARRRWRRTRQINRDIATAMRSLTDEEVASWLS